MLSPFTLIRILFNVFSVLFVGVFVARLLDARGVTRGLEARFGPLLEAFHIPRPLVMAFFTAFFAAFASEALISLFVKEGRLEKEDIIPGLMLIDFPNFVSFAPLILAITVPLVGRAGLYYLMIQLSISAVMTTAGALAFSLRKRAHHTEVEPMDPAPCGVKGALKEAAFISLRVTFVVFVALCAVYVLSRLGVMEVALRKAACLRLPCLGPKVLPISVAHALHVAAGAAVARDMMARGLAAHLVALGMVWGYVLGTPFRGMRLGIPRYCALFGVKEGIKTWAVVQSLRCAVAALAAALMCIVSAAVGTAPPSGAF